MPERNADIYRGYNALAALYDRFWGANSLALLPGIERLLLSEIPRGSRILDLACGTGQLANEIALRGFRVTGLDASERMIQIARRNAPGVAFIVSDIRHVGFRGRFQGAICAYDSINHLLTPEDVERAFEAARSCLLPGSRFVFDLNMEEGFKTRWKGSLGLAEDDVAAVLKADYDPRSKMAELRCTFFLFRKDIWQRQDVLLRERCYEKREISSMLKAAGFSRVGTYEAESDLGIRGSGRTFFVAETGR